MIKVDGGGFIMNLKGNRFESTHTYVIVTIVTDMSRPRLA